MFNVLFLGLYVLVLLIQCFLFKSYTREGLLQSLVGVSFAFVVIYVSLFIHFLDVFILVTLILILSVSLLLYNWELRYKKTNELETTLSLLYVIYNTLVMVLLFIFIPLTVMTIAWDVQIKIGVLIIYFIVIVLYSRVDLNIEKGLFDIVMVILFIGLMYTIIGSSEILSNYRDESYYFRDTDAYPTISYDYIAGTDSSEIADSMSYDVKMYIDDDYVYLYEQNRELTVDETLLYGSDSEWYHFTVIDIETDSIVYATNIQLLTGENLYPQISADSERLFYKQDTTLYMVFRNCILYYDGELKEVKDGRSNNLSLQQDELYVVDGYDVYYLDNGNLVLTNDIVLDENRYYGVINNIMYSEPKNYSELRYIEVNGSKYYGSILYYLTDTTLLIGFNDAFVPVDGVYHKVENVGYRNLIYCDGGNYVRSGFYDYEQGKWDSILKKYSDDFELERQVLLEDVRETYCVNDELYGVVRLDEEEQWDYGIVKIHLDEMNDIQPSWYDDYVTFYGVTTSKSYLFFFLVVFKVIRKENEK